MARRTREEALQTRERILEAAIEVFHERGVARPSLTDIARLAGVTRGAVYGHFQNKVDLFSALCERVQLPTEAICEADAAACGGGDPLGMLRNTWVEFFRKAATDDAHRRVLDIIFHRCELVADNGLLQERLHSGHKDSLARMGKMIAAAVAKGQLPADLDIERAVLLLHGALIGVLNEWLFRSDAYDLAAEAERFVDALLEMLKVAPGLRRAAEDARA